MTLILALSEFEYTCGAPVLPPNSSLAKTVMCKDNLGCATHVEIPYYGSSIGRLDICAHCGVPEALVNTDLKKRFKTVLPICDDCVSQGRESIVHRPYGRQNRL